MKLVVWRRCILESKLEAVECADRLGRVTQRVKLPFARRPLVGWTSRDAFSVRWARSRTMLMPRANGTFVAAPGPRSGDSSRAGRIRHRASCGAPLRGLLLV